jgi:hypothetical protein
MTTTIAPTTSSVAPAWPHWTFRIVATVAALLLFVQSVLAGQFIADKSDKLAFVLHRENATLASVVVVLLIVAAILSRWPGRGPGGPIVASIGLLVVTAGEAAAGYGKLTQLHVPLGVLLIGISVGMAIAAWRRPVHIVTT